MHVLPFSSQSLSLSLFCFRLLISHDPTIATRGPALTLSQKAKHFLLQFVIDSGMDMNGQERTTRASWIKVTFLYGINELVLLSDQSSSKNKKAGPIFHGGHKLGVCHHASWLLLSALPRKKCLGALALKKMNHTDLKKQYLASLESKTIV